MRLIDASRNGWRACGSSRRSSAAFLILVEARSDLGGSVLVIHYEYSVTRSAAPIVRPVQPWRVFGIKLNCTSPGGMRPHEPPVLPAPSFAVGRVCQTTYSELPSRPRHCTRLHTRSRQRTRGGPVGSRPRRAAEMAE
jgi:hypothetical protein